MFISILGRQRGLSLAELEVLFGQDKIRPLSPSAALIDARTPDINTLGGSIKIIKEAHKLQTTNLQSALNDTTDTIERHLNDESTGKTTIGLSVYDDKLVKTKMIQRYLIEMKKKMRANGFSVRVIPNKHPQLNSAQVLHNKLTSNNNLEIVLIKTSSGYWMGRASGVQDIEALSRRDQERPKRDSKVGMLPPKLALTMLNLARGSNATRGTVLDPFCGTGVILQEALLLGYDIYGTDIETRMIDYTRDNIQWLTDNYTRKSDSNNFTPRVRFEQGDARSHLWKKPIEFVVSETYLGPPLRHAPDPAELTHIISDADSLIRSFLINLYKQVETGVRLCIAVPAWRIDGKIKHLPMVDDLENLGYTRSVLKNATFDDMVYYRPNQTVARELLVLERK